MSDTNCVECGALFLIPPYSGASGYAVLQDERVCYACADRYQRIVMHSAEIMGVYFDSLGTVTTWTGDKLGDVIGYGKVGATFGRSQTARSLRVRAFDGSLWYARYAETGMHCTLRRVKGGKS